MVINFIYGARVFNKLTLAHDEQRRHAPVGIFQKQSPTPPWQLMRRSPKKSAHDKEGTKK